MAFLESSAYHAALNKTADYRKRVFHVGATVASVVLAISLLFTDAGSALAKACLRLLAGGLIFAGRAWQDVAVFLEPHRWVLFLFGAILWALFAIFYRVRSQIMEHLVETYAENPPNKGDSRGALAWSSRNFRGFRLSASALVILGFATLSAFLASNSSFTFVGAGVTTVALFFLVIQAAPFFMPKSGLSGFSFAHKLIGLKVTRFIENSVKFPSFYVLRNHFMDEASSGHRLGTGKGVSFPAWAAAMHQAGFFDLNSPLMTLAVKEILAEAHYPKKNPANGATQEEHEAAAEQVLAAWRQALRDASPVKPDEI